VIDINNDELLKTIMETYKGNEKRVNIINLIYIFEK
jgi:hypothetical protein